MPLQIPSTTMTLFPSLQTLCVELPSTTRCSNNSAHEYRHGIECFSILISAQSKTSVLWGTKSSFVDRIELTAQARLFLTVLPCALKEDMVCGDSHTSPLPQVPSRMQKRQKLIDLQKAIFLEKRNCFVYSAFRWAFVYFCVVSHGESSDYVFIVPCIVVFCIPFARKPDEAEYRQEVN